MTIDNPFAYAQLLVTATLSSGEKVDVTRMVKVEAPARLVNELVGVKAIAVAAGKNGDEQIVGQLLGE